MDKELSGEIRIVGKPQQPSTIDAADHITHMPGASAERCELPRPKGRGFLLHR